MSVNNKVISDWWYNLPLIEKEVFMEGKVWPGSIPERFELEKEFYYKR